MILRRKSTGSYIQDIETTGVGADLRILNIVWTKNVRLAEDLAWFAGAVKAQLEAVDPGNFELERRTLKKGWLLKLAKPYFLGNGIRVQQGAMCRVFEDTDIEDHFPCVKVTVSHGPFMACFTADLHYFVF